MRAVSKADYNKCGNIPSYEVLTVFTNGGVWKADEMYFYDYDEDTEHLCWDKQRIDFAKSAMNAMLANPELLEVVTNKEYVVGKSCQERVAKNVCRLCRCPHCRVEKERGVEWII